MRLYKIELYKICSKKMFIYSALASLAILLLYFWSYVISTESTINGVKYTGYQAVRMDRGITEEFKGALTDQKVAQIIEKYGFPSGVEEFSNVFTDRNYLNDFIMNGFSDGYFHDFEDYRVGTCTYPIAETELGKASAMTGKALLLEYSYGWKAFTEVLQTGCILGIALTLIALSPVFSGENSVNTRQILFTTKEGPAKDILVKIAAGITVAAGIYAVILLLVLVLSWSVFGLDGLNCFYGQVMQGEPYISDWNEYHNATTDYMREFLCYYVLSCFLAMAETGAVSLYFSAHCKSSLQSVVAVIISILLPLLLFILRQDQNSIFVIMNVFPLILLGIALMSFVPEFSNKGYSCIAKTVCCALPAAMGYFLRYRFLFYVSLPIWLIMEGMYWDISIWREIYPWLLSAVVGFAAVSSVIFLVCSWRKYKCS